MPMSGYNRDISSVETFATLSAIIDSFDVKRIGVLANVGRTSGALCSCTRAMARTNQFAV